LDERKKNHLRGREENLSFSGIGVFEQAEARSVAAREGKTLLKGGGEISILSPHSVKKGDPRIK